MRAQLFIATMFVLASHCLAGDVLHFEALLTAKVCNVFSLRSAFRKTRVPVTLELAQSGQWPSYQTASQVLEYPIEELKDGRHLKVVIGVAQRTKDSKIRLDLRIVHSILGTMAQSMLVMDSLDGLNTHLLRTGPIQEEGNIITAYLSLKH
ncbi:MAG: hypothetical protein HY537_03690 [Deltaproteobacteria bacterium]|nr:hypothetical protein [Deltaproteobacteria bacterium]